MRRAAGDLQIDHAIPDPVAPDGFAQDHAKRAQVHGLRHAQLRKRALKPLHMAALVDQAAVAHLADLVDAVGKLEAAILGVHGRVRVRGVNPVDINNPRHAVPVYRFPPSACALDAALRADVNRAAARELVSVLLKDVP